MRTLYRGLLTAAVLLTPLSAKAEPLTVTVRVDAPERQALVDRVRGQLSDVDANVASAVTEPLDASFRAQVRRARGLRGELVVWVSQGAVHVLEPSERRLFSRALGPAASAEQPLESADLEQAALVVRTAVEEVLEGRSLGVDEDQGIAEVELRAMAAPEQPVTTSRTPAPSGESDGAQESAALAAPESPLGVALGFGWRGRIDGQTEVGAHGGWLSGALRWGIAELGLRLSFGAPLPVFPIPEAEVDLSRHGARLTGAVRLWDAPWLRVAVTVEAGAWLALRQTTSTAEDFEATEDAWLLGVGGATGVHVEVPLGPVVAITVGVGLDLAVPAPSFRVQGDVDLRPRALWPVQPYADVGMVFLVSH